MCNDRNISLEDLLGSLSERDIRGFLEDVGVVAGSRRSINSFLPSIDLWGVSSSFTQGFRNDIPLPRGHCPDEDGDSSQARIQASAATNRHKGCETQDDLQKN